MHGASYDGVDENSGTRWDGGSGRATSSTMCIGVSNKRRCRWGGRRATIKRVVVHGPAATRAGHTSGGQEREPREPQALGRRGEGGRGTERKGEGGGGGSTGGDIGRGIQGWSVVPGGEGEGWGGSWSVQSMGWRGGA